MRLSLRLSQIAGVLSLSLAAQIASAQTVPTCTTALTAAQRGKVKFVPGHYAAIGSKETIAQNFTNVLEEISAPGLTTRFVGVQKRYYWSDLNPVFGTTGYRFQRLRDDIEEAKAAGKRLSVMIMFKFRGDFDQSSVPNHIKSLSGTTASGAFQKPWYKVNGDGNKPNSEVANFGHPVVRDRFLIFLKELAKVVDDDNTVTSVVFPESAMGIKPGVAPYEDLTAAEFAPVKAAHAAGLKYIDQVSGCLFKHTPVIPLTNYPVDELPGFYSTFDRFKLALGGPDIWVDDNNVEPSYTNVKSLNAKLPVGYIIAGGNYVYVKRAGEEEEHKVGGNPEIYTHKYVNHWTTAETPRRTIQALLAKAQTLGVNYLFWKKNADFGDDYWDALKDEVIAGRIPNLDSNCPYYYTLASGFGQGCVKSLP
jgi:hypothetical protein